MKNKKLKKIQKNLKDLIEIQCSDGNWNYDQYMRGMANGMILSMSVIDGNDPESLDDIDSYIVDDDNKIKKTMKSLTKIMKKDSEYAYGWHCNLAMACYDSMQSDYINISHEQAHAIGNETASRFMKLLFNVETELKK